MAYLTHRGLLPLLSVLVILAFTSPALAVVDKWTPAGFNWSSHDAGHPSTWKGLYHNLSDPSVNVSKAVMAVGDIRTAEDGTQLLAIPFFLGVAWQAFSVVLTGAGLASTIKGCVQNEGEAANIFFCVTGILSTIVGVGGIASAAKTLAQSRGYLGVAAAAWDQSGLESIALNVFSRRDVLAALDEGDLTAQKAHNHFVHTALRSLAEDGSAVEFVGYAPDNHRLARRGLADAAEHPLAPMFRFRHKRYGGMEVTSRDTGAAGGLHLTVSYVGHDTHLATKEKRDEYYQHERLDGSGGIMEGRFDSEASNADSATISFDGAAAFDQIESSVECFAGTEWNEGNVMSVQMYDQANEATFGFASIGMFADSSTDSNLEDFQPSGMPLPECSS